jgi:spoIIIJ-associated protein
MEWVETTGRSIEEAKDAALDRLGVDETEAEFEVIDEPRFGLFGRLRSEARVRARVRPTAPRPKEDRRDRRRRRGGDGAEGTAVAISAADEAGHQSVSPADPAKAAGNPAAGRGRPGRATPSRDARHRPAPPQAASPARSTQAGGSSTQASARLPGDQQNWAAAGDGTDAAVETGGATGGAVDHRGDGGTAMDVSLGDQADVARQFLDGLIEEMDLDAEININQLEEDTVELRVDGSDLGLLIGAKGATLLALQDLTRTVVQRRTGAANGRLVVDVSGYRQKRKEALERFARQLAEEVKTHGARKVLEPMSAADRKIVHDTVNALDGVTTTSEGEEPRRRVIILPTPR